jgi:hypothetical protein
MQSAACALPFSLYRVYDETGERASYEAAYFDHRRRLNTFALLAMLYPEREEYLTWLEDTIWAICDEYTWSVPAHLIGGGTDVRVPRFGTTKPASWITAATSTWSSWISSPVKPPLRSLKLPRCSKNGLPRWWCTVPAPSAIAGF